MKRIYILVALLMSLFSAVSCAQQKKVHQDEFSKKEIRTVAILGDSYSTFDGYIPEGNACWYFTTPQGDNDVVAVEQTWWYQFCKDGGYELLMNESYSGSTICNTGYDGVDYSDRSFCYRMNLLVTGEEIADLILVFGGTNDSWANSPIGELKYEDWDPQDMYSCLPACCFMLDHLTTRAPESEIVFIINSELKPDIANGITEACAHYGVHSLLLKDIEKKWGHPSIAGMVAINEQVSALVGSLE